MHVIVRTLLLVMCCVLAAHRATAQPDGSAADLPNPTAESIQQRLDTLGEESAAAELYREALVRLEQASSASQRAERARAEARAAPSTLRQIREALARPSVDPAPEIPADATLAQLEQAEARAIAELNASRDRLAELQAESTRRQERRGVIPGAIARAKQRLVEVEGSLRSGPTEADDVVLVDARRTLLLAERAELAAEIEALEAELASYDARRDLLPARRDRETRRVSQAEQLVAAWREIVSARRKDEAERAAREAERLSRQVARAHPVLQTYAAATQALAEQRTRPGSIPQRIEAGSKEVSDVRSAFIDLRRRYNSVRQRIESMGLNRATGLMLRREFETLPDADTLYRRVLETQRELEAVEYTLFERKEDRAGSDDIARATQDLLGELDEVTASRAQIAAVAAELTSARRDVLADLENDADRYQDVLVDLLRESRRLYEATEAYESYIRERILWIRSISGDVAETSGKFGSATELLLDPGSWVDALDRTRADIAQHIATTALSVAAIVSLFAGGVWGRRRLGHVAGLVGRYRTDSFARTLEAIVLSALVAAPLPAVLWWSGWLLARPVDQVSLADALGAGLRESAFLLYALGFLRVAMRPDGLGDAHFRWPAACVRLVRRHLRWFVPVVIPAVIIVTAVDKLGDEGATASYGRVAFTVSLGAFALLLFRVARPRGALCAELLKGDPGGWLDRLRFVWYPLLGAVPIALIAVAWLGYYYTALELVLRLESTIGLALGLVLLNGVLTRWLFLARRRVAVEDARRRREQVMAEVVQKRKTGEGVPAESSVPPVDEDKVNLPGISLQTRQLFRTAIIVSAVLGTYVIWADVLPALRILDRVEVYPDQRIVESFDEETIAEFESAAVVSAAAPAQSAPAAPASSGTNGQNGAGSANGFIAPGALPGPVSVDTDDPGSDDALDAASVTLAEVGFAVLLLVATVVAFRNLPGLIEIMVLQRLPLDAGSRYALSTVIRYAIAIVGILAAFSAIDLSWSRVQWLAAALTFGLAFGLQEIFANFVSGLIILAERPIRIGDTVTVGETTGTVTRIRMRATTITDWDRKELIIPNRTFITGEVINWTLSDPVLRLIVVVGVSYSADVRKAEAILLRVASEQPTVLEDPKPYVIFGRFGDSTLDFELRVFIPHIDHILTVRHDLHMRITEAFREAGVEIAFPQRDLHLRSIGELKGLIAPEGELRGKKGG